MKDLKLLKYLQIIFNPKIWRCLWNYWCGLGAMVEHKYEKAIFHFKRCLKKEIPIRISGLICEQLGKCYFDTNEINKGKIYLLKALETKASRENINSEISSRLGFIFYEEGDLEKARYYLEKACERYKERDYTNIQAVRQYLAKLKEVKGS